jgi:hypothetical protein
MVLPSPNIPVKNDYLLKIQYAHSPFNKTPFRNTSQNVTKYISFSLNINKTKTFTPQIKKDQK